MITSPTGRSVILIGGLYSYTTNDDDDKWGRRHSNSMIELAENSAGDLEWKVIKPKLQPPRYHQKILFPNELLNDFMSSYILKILE